MITSLKNALFYDDEDDVKAVTEVLLARGVPAEDIAQIITNRYLRLTRSVKRLISKVSATLPIWISAKHYFKPDVLKEKFDSVIECYKETSPSLITEAFLKEHENNMKHIVKGCLSDHPDVAVNYEMPSGPDAEFRRYKCARGSSPLEHFHDYEFTSIKTKQCGLELADMLLSNIIHRFNCRAGVAAGIYSDIGIYDHSIVYQIIEFASANSQWFSHEVFPEVKLMPMSSADSLERFGCQKTVLESTTTNDSEDSDDESSDENEETSDDEISDGDLAVNCVGKLIEGRMTFLIPASSLFTGTSTPAGIMPLDEARIAMPVRY